MQEEVSKLRLDEVEGRVCAASPKDNTDSTTEVHSAAARVDHSCVYAGCLDIKRDTALADRANLH